MPCPALQGARCPYFNKAVPELGYPYKTPWCNLRACDPSMVQGCEIAKDSKLNNLGD